MKKFVSCILVFMLLTFMFGAYADDTTVVVPNKFTRLEPQLPVLEEQPHVRTKTADGVIKVRVDSEPDVVYANWLGYGESKEEVALENGFGAVELEGHKYQLGAKWNNKLYRSYFAFDGSDWVPVEYHGAVIVGTTEMKLIGDATPIDDLTYNKAWVWIYDKANVDMESIESITNPGESTEFIDVLVAGYPDKTGVTEGKEIITGDSVDISDGKYQNTYWNDSIYSVDGNLIADNVVAYDKDYNISVATGWTYMVPWYQFNETVTGRASKGAPNYAWIVEKGPWTDTYTRAGKLVVVEKDEENTDYFKTGLAGAAGTVIWQLNSDNWYVSSIAETYPDGDIAKVEAVYNAAGALVRYFITYRTGESETYRIKYTPDNKPAYGWYTGVDITGTKIRAFTASSKKWADSATHKLASSFDLDWHLIPLTEWTNPPRLAK